MLYKIPVPISFLCVFKFLPMKTFYLIKGQLQTRGPSDKMATTSIPLISEYICTGRHCAKYVPSLLDRTPTGKGKILTTFAVDCL